MPVVGAAPMEDTPRPMLACGCQGRGGGKVYGRLCQIQQLPVLGRCTVPGHRFLWRGADPVLGWRSKYQEAGTILGCGYQQYRDACAVAGYEYQHWDVGTCTGMQVL